MKLSTLLYLAALVSARVNRCGTAPPDEDFKTLHHEYMAKAMRVGSRGDFTERQIMNRTIDVYAHVIMTGITEEQGNLPQELVDAQVDVLSSRFQDSGFIFYLADTSRTINATWSNIKPGSADEIAMKSTLRRGSYNALNIYLTYINLPGLTIGYAFLPKRPSKLDFILDGLVLHPGTVPGGILAPFNEGITAVHEVGHWMGLLHTFEGGCSNLKGDFVLDTPAEKGPAFGCDVGRDSCTGNDQLGMDPVRNYMDYSDDSCLMEFSAGQGLRMRQMFKLFRAGFTGVVNSSGGGK